MRFLCLSLCMMLCCLAALPTTSAAQEATQIAAGGVISLNDAPLTIAREHLTFSPTRVVADYTFRNDTPDPITTTMAFLVPVYTLELTRDDQRRQGFKDAEFAVDGVATGFDTEARALLHGADVTAELMEFGIDIASFGHYDHGSPDLRKLGQKQMDQLVKLGLYTRSSKLDGDPQPEWTVAKRYVREMDFAPGIPVRVQLTYTPVPGVIGSLLYENPDERDLTPAGTLDPETLPDLRRVCAGPEMQARLQRFLAQPHHFAGLTFVDFYLTGNHAWKSPVRDFTLEIDTPPATPATVTVPSVCWNGTPPVVTPSTWIGKARNFTSASDLRIGWFLLDSREF